MTLRRDELPEDEGAWVLSIRKKHYMSQADLAVAMTERNISWHQNVVSLVEMGRRQLKVREARVLVGIESEPPRPCRTCGRPFAKEES